MARRLSTLKRCSACRLRTIDWFYWSPLVTFPALNLGALWLLNWWFPGSERGGEWVEPPLREVCGCALLLSFAAGVISLSIVAGGDWLIFRLLSRGTGPRNHLKEKHCGEGTEG